MKAESIAFLGAEKICIYLMWISGFVSMGILTAMGMSKDCGCTCDQNEGSNTSTVWGVSLGVVAVIPAILLFIYVTILKMRNQTSKVSST